MVFVQRLEDAVEMRDGLEPPFRRVARVRLRDARSGWTGGDINTPEQAREWVRWAARKGVDGLKLGAYRRVPS